MANFDNFWHAKFLKNLMNNFTFILSLHYLVKFKSRSLAVYNYECILGSACIGSEVIS